MENNKIASSIIIKSSNVQITGNVNIYHSEQVTSIKRKRTSNNESSNLTITTFDFTQNESILDCQEKIQFTYKLVFQNLPKKILTNPQTNPLKSKHFCPPKRNEPKFSLELWLKGEDEKNRDYISLFLHSLLESHKSEFSILYKMSIIGRNELEQHSMENELNLCLEKKSGWEQYIKHAELLRQADIIFAQNVLTINCQIKYDQRLLSLFESNEQINLENRSEVENPNRNIYCNLWNNQKFSDLKILVNNKPFNVHKLVLYDRAPKFAQIHEIEHQNEIKIDEIEMEIFEELLKFFYKNEINNVKMLAIKLFEQAEKYELPDLKTYCENVLITKLSNYSVCDLLIFAQASNALTLKARAIEYFNDHVGEIASFDKLNTSLWQEIYFERFRKENPYTEIVHI